MADDTAPVPQFGTMKLGATIVALSPIPMNIIYFEEAPSLSHMNGIIGITLAVTGNVPDAPNEGIKRCASVVGHLKCNIPAAMALRAALDNALLLAQPVEKPEGKAN
jgi:hypothetical protein